MGHEGKRPKRKGLRKKIVAAILIAGILPLTLGIYLTYLSGISLLTTSIGSNFETIANETAKKIDIIIIKELVTAQNLSMLPSIIEVVERSNLSYSSQTEGGIRGSIDVTARSWMLTGADNPPVKNILNNELSVYLRSLHNFKKDYSAILVTDERGVLVATTDRGFDYYQGNQKWWQVTYNNGKGGTFISDIHFDIKEKGYLMEIAVPVLKTGTGNKRAIGAVKILYKADQIFEVIAGVKIDKTGHANLVTSSGEIIICPIFPPKSHVISMELTRTVSSNFPGWSISGDDGHGNKHSIIGFAPVRFPKERGINNFADRGWHVFIRQDPAETYTPIYNLLLKVSISGFLLIGIFTLTGFYAANKIVEPILLLKEEAELIGKGNLDHRVRIRTKDEIGALAEEFNQMAEKLKHSLDQLKRERDKLELILLSAGEGIVVADAKDKVIMLNPEAEKILGVNRVDIEGKSIFPCHKNPDKVAKLLNEEVGLPLSTTTLLNDKIIGINVAPIKSKEGFIGSVMIMKVITLFKEMEKELKQYSEQLEKMIDGRTKELKETKEYLESLLENANDVIFTIDMAGIFTYINQKAEEWGYTKEELIGKPLYSISPGENQPWLDHKSLMDCIKQTCEVRIKNKEGEIRDVVISASPLKDNNGTVIGLLGIAMDVTERKRLEEQINRAEKLSAIGQLSMGIAHEINNPLSGMLNCVRTLSDEGADAYLRTRYLALIEKGLNRIESIIKQLLGFAKEYQFELKPHSLDDLITETVDLIRYKIEQENIRLKLNLNCGKNIYLLPGNHLQQVILNIAINAIHAMPEGGILTIESYNCKEKLIVVIYDTGIGIPEENIRRIFDPFFTTKDVGIGTGLGLSLSYGIIEKLGGHIEVASEAGKGSTFTVTIPHIEVKEEIGFKV